MRGYETRAVQGSYTWIEPANNSALETCLDGGHDNTGREGSGDVAIPPIRAPVCGRGTGTLSRGGRVVMFGRETRMVMLVWVSRRSGSVAPRRWPWLVRSYLGVLC